MDGSSDPGSGGGGGGCGGECEVNDDGECVLCVMWREIFSYNPSTDGKKKFLVPAASDGSSSSGGSGCGGECEMNDDGAKQFLAVASDDTSDDGDSNIGGECEMNDDGAKQFLAVASDGSRDTSSIPQEVGAVPPCGLCDHQALNEHVQPSNDYIMLPECFVTKAQDEKVLELAHTKKPEIPLHVASMKKVNVNSKDSCVYIPLQLVPNHFKDETTKATIKLEAPPVTGNPSSSTQETSGDSVHSVDPPPREVIDLSSSDDDDIVREGTEESCRVQKRVTRSCAKTQKIASTSSPSAKSGPGARKPRDRACGKLGVGSKRLPKNLEGPSQRPYIFFPGKTLPWQTVKKIEEKVQEIRSELSIFVKVMTYSTVDGTSCKACEVVFCMKYAKACLPDKRQKLFLQLEGKRRLWETTLVVRRHRHMKERRISEGWKEFCRQNGLGVGDICLFKLEDTNTRSLKMTVYLIRRSQIEV